MKPLLLLTLLFLSLLASAAPSKNEIETLELHLTFIPSEGPEFDSLYTSFAKDGALGQLEARWKARAETDPSASAVFWLLLSFLANREHRPADAILYAQNAAALSYDDSRLAAPLEKIFLPAARTPEEIAALQKALAASEKPGVRRALYRQLAHARQRASDAAGALAAWRQLIQEFPSDPTALYEAGDAMTDAARYADAQAFYEAARDSQRAYPKTIATDERQNITYLGTLRDDPAFRKALAVLKLAQLAELQCENEKARALYQSIIPLEPNPGIWIADEARLRLEDSYRRAGDLPGLAAFCESWLATHDADFGTVRCLIDALLDLGRNQEAFVWLQKASAWARDEKDKHSAAGENLAVARRFLEADHPQEAFAILHQLAAAPPDHRTFFGDGPPPTEQMRFMGHLRAILVKTKSEAAKRSVIDEFRRIARSPIEARSAAAIAWIFRSHGLTAEALPLYELAMKEDPSREAFRVVVADGLTDLKRDAEARKLLHGIVEGSPAKPADFLRLARIWRARDHNDDALQTVQAGLAIDPENFDLLSLEWTLFAAANRWPDAAGLSARLLAAAPAPAAARVLDNAAHALRKLGKLKDTLRESAPRLTEGAPLTEAELRLFIGLALRDDDLNLADRALDAAARLFPDSPPFLADRAEYELRQGRVEQGIAAFQRLAELQPAQKTAWLRKIAALYRGENLPEKAVAVARQIVEADQANRDSYLFAADEEIAAGHFDAGAALLREAIHRFPHPNPVRLKLARAFQKEGRLEEAREIFEAVFDEDSGDSGNSTRLSLVDDLADVCARLGRLDELIAHFRQCLQRGRDAWPYAVYLSEIRRRQSDLAGAREELVKASGPLSRADSFLEERLRISEDEHNASERARLARLLTAARRGRGDAPVEVAEVALVSPLAGDGETDEALRVMKEWQIVFFRDPMPWHDAFGHLAAAGAGPQVVAFLRTGLARHADDWRLRFLLAEALLRTGDIDAADQLFREIASLSPEASPPPAHADFSSARSDPAFADGAAASPGFSGPAGAEFAKRMLRGTAARQDLVRIAMEFEGHEAPTGPESRDGNPDPFVKIATVPKTLAEAADMALVIRSVLAQRQGRGPAFLAELQEELKVQPRSERLAILTLVQALDPLIKEIAEEAAHPSGDETINADCLEILMTLAREPSPAGEAPDVDLARLIPLLQTFLQRERRPEPLFAGKRLLSSMLSSAERAVESAEIAHAVLTHWDAVPPSLDADLFRFALDNGDLDAASKILSRFAAASHTRGSPLDDDLASTQTSLARAILAQRRADPRADPHAAPLLADALRISFGMTFPSLSDAPALRARSIWNQARIFLDGNRFIAGPRQIAAWSEIFALAQKAGLLADLKLSLQKHIPDLPPAQSAHSAMARICFLWWDHQKDDAIREIAGLADAAPPRRQPV